MSNLKILKLKDLNYLTTIPDVSGAPNIEELFVGNCRKLVELHDPLGSHKRISKLEVISCNRLKSLPSRLEMESLTLLLVDWCSSLESFPDVSGAPNIEKLFVFNCKNLAEFHKSLGSHKRISRLMVSSCNRLKSLPSSFEMEALESLYVKNCFSLERFPDLSPCMVKLSEIEVDCCSSIEGLLSSLGYMSNIEYMYLGRFGGGMKKDPSMISMGYMYHLGEDDDTKALESQSKSISLQTLKNFCSLRKLSLSYRPMESEFFVKNLRLFFLLEDLDLSGNNNLIQLPTTISLLPYRLMLYGCHQLQIIQGIPSGIERLAAKNCYSPEKIDELSQEKYIRWYDISFVNCKRLVKDEDSKRYLEKMFLRESFFKRCCALRDRWISIVIAGNKIPRWFKEEQVGCEIRLVIPPNCNKQIKGIAIRAVFPPLDWQEAYCYPDVSDIEFRKADGVSFLQNQSHIPNSVSDSVLPGKRWNMWLSYSPVWSISEFDQRGREDWSEGGTLLISIKLCGYKEAPPIHTPNKFCPKFTTNRWRSGEPETPIVTLHRATL